MHWLFATDRGGTSTDESTKQGPKGRQVINSQTDWPDAHELASACVTVSYTHLRAHETSAHL
eukprot:14811424-Alexandrium_andersonii.AAC.1